MHAIQPPMEYKGIEYAVRARPGPHQWVWTILPKGEAALMSQFVGSKEGAPADVCRGIDRWLERQSARGRAFARKVARRAAGEKRLLVEPSTRQPIPPCAR